MALYFSSINSGSNGNCYYIGNDREAVLVDAGLSCKEIEKRMARMGLSLLKVKAIFISHEHSDHIKGLSVLAKKYRLPLYISRSTLKNSHILLDEEQVHSIDHLQTFSIGKLKIAAFSKHHDAADPYSFCIESEQVKIGIFTDIGMVCDRLISQFKNCHVAFLEANYDTNMLANGRYPDHLKRRITSGKGHLSNTEALNLFINHKSEYMSHLLLSHLSKDNNDPEQVESLFKRFAGNTMVTIASRYKEGPVYFVAQQPATATYTFNPALYQPEQLSLFSAF